jgi:hypothetical protein
VGRLGGPKPPPLAVLPHGTSLPDLGDLEEGFFFFVLLLLHKRMAVRVNRLDYETVIFFDGVHLLPRR